MPAERVVAPVASIDLEQWVIGALLVDNGLYEPVAQVLRPEDFYYDAPRRLFQHIRRLIRAGQPADVLTVSDSLAASNETEQAGSLADLGELANAVVGIAQAPAWAARIVEKARLRQLQAAGHRIAQIATTPGSADALLLEAQGLLAPLLEARSAEAAGGCVDAEVFLAASEAPEMVIHGILQRGYVYALTAPTNHGKTAVSLLMAMCVATGTRFGPVEVAPGNVLVLCGENQDGFRLRMLATLRSIGMDVEDVKGRVWVLPYAAPLASLLDTLRLDARGMGALSMVLVDTSVAFFGGEDENDNIAALAHARALRELAALPGKPAVVANCHPSGTTPEREKCVPRGGTAFLNEIDANLTVWADGETAELHWLRKKRGPDFEPMWFEFKPMRMDYAEGVLVDSLVAAPIDEGREREIKERHRQEENRMLFQLLHHPNDSFSQWANGCGFVSTTGQPLKSKVFRVLEKLTKCKLVEKDERHGYRLTKRGEEEARSVL